MDLQEELYVSGPMTGYERFNYDRFDYVAADLRGQGYTVHTPSEIDGGLQLEEGQPPKPYQYYLGEALKLQLKATAWVGIEGWTKSTGAMREFQLAIALNQKLYIYIDGGSDEGLESGILVRMI